jgi:hypothetical protein
VGRLKARLNPREQSLVRRSRHATRPMQADAAAAARAVHGQVRLLTIVNPAVEPVRILGACRRGSMNVRHA